MGNPTHTSVHVNRPLTTVSVGFSQEATDFVSTRAFPIVPVSKETDSYFIYNQGDWNRDEAQLRADGTPAAETGYRVTTATYTADNWALKKVIGPKERKNSDAPLAPEMDALDMLMNKQMIRRERIWSTNFFTTGKWSTDRTGGTDFTVWGDDSSDPIGYIEDQFGTIRLLSGKDPNKFVMGWDVWAQLKNHPDVVARIDKTSSPTAPAKVREQAFAELIGVDEILIGKATYNTAKEGQTASMSRILGKHALLVYASPTPALRRISGGYTFAWNDLYPGTSDMGISVRTWFDDNTAGTHVETNVAQDQKLVTASAGVFFNGAVS